MKVLVISTSKKTTRKTVTSSGPTPIVEDEELEKFYKELEEEP